MERVAIVYWSGTGNTEAMAGFVAEGVRSSGREPVLIGADGFSPSDLDGYSAFAFGCPSMGDEVLEEDVFEPMFASVRSGLSGRRVGLFGSYGWGDGEWMRDWAEDCRSAGMDLVNDGVIANEYPGESEAEGCRALGRSI